MTVKTFLEFIKTISEIDRWMIMAMRRNISLRFDQICSGNSMLRLLNRLIEEF